MPQISKVQLKDVLEAQRFDAEFFKPLYLEDQEIITYKKMEFLKNLNSFNTQ